jgi:hypothetical protein
MNSFLRRALAPVPVLGSNSEPPSSANSLRSCTARTNSVRSHLWRQTPRGEVAGWLHTTRGGGVVREASSARSAVGWGHGKVKVGHLTFPRSEF